MAAPWVLIDVGRRIFPRRSLIIAAPCPRHESRREQRPCLKIPSFFFSNFVHRCRIGPWPPVSFKNLGRRTSRANFRLRLDLRDLAGVSWRSRLRQRPFSIAAGGRSSASCRAFSTIARRIAAFVSHTISNRSLAILPEIVPSPIRSTIEASWLGGDGRSGNVLRFPCSEAARKTRLMDEIRPAALASRALGGRPRRSRRSRASSRSGTPGIVGARARNFSQKARLLLVRQFRQARFELGDEGRVEFERQQIGIGGSSGSRAPLPCCASSASRPCSNRTAAFPGRSCRRPSMISIWRARFRTRSPGRRSGSNSRSLISQRVPSAAPGLFAPTR